MNKYIQSLIDDNKLNLSVQADQWKFDKNPFTVEGGFEQSRQSLAAGLNTTGFEIHLFTGLLL